MSDTIISVRRYNVLCKHCVLVAAYTRTVQSLVVVVTVLVWRVLSRGFILFYFILFYYHQHTHVHT